MNRDEFVRISNQHVTAVIQGDPRQMFIAAQLDDHDAEQRDRITALTDWLTAIAGARQEADEWEHPDFDWRLLARKQEVLARRALLESTTTRGNARIDHEPLRSNNHRKDHQ